MDRVNHLGNELFSTVVLKYVEKYKRAKSKREKMETSKGALDELTSSGVRFLKKHPVHQYWYVADSKVARDRIGHFLRFHLSEHNQRDARGDNMGRASRLSSHSRHLIAFAGSLRKGVGSARCEASGGTISHGCTPNTESDAPATFIRSITPSAFARNINIFPRCNMTSNSSYSRKEKGRLSGLFPSSESCVVPSATAPLKGCPDQNYNASLLHLNWSMSQTAASSFDSFPSDNYAPVSVTARDAFPSHCLSILIPYEVESNGHDNLEDLFDDADLAECLDWQAQ